MTNLEYLRMLISDPESKMFTDTQLTFLLNKRVRIQVKRLVKNNEEGTIFSFEGAPLEETFTPVIYQVIGGDYDDVTSTATIDKDAGIVSFTNEMSGNLLIEAKFVDWNNLRADIYEIIAGDFKKLVSFNAVGTSKNLGDVKSFLLHLADRYRGAKGSDLE
jgi:hypothetical protein